MARRRLLAAVLSAVLIGSGTALAQVGPAQAAAAPNCAAFNDPIYLRINPLSQGSLLTPWLTELAKALSFSQDEGVLFRAAIQDDDTLAPVHRLRKNAGGDYLYENSQAEIDAALADGYVDQGS